MAVLGSTTGPLFFLVLEFCQEVADIEILVRSRMLDVWILLWILGYLSGCWATYLDVGLLLWMYVVRLGLGRDLMVKYHHFSGKKTFGLVLSIFC